MCAVLPRRVRLLSSCFGIVRYFRDCRGVSTCVYVSRKTRVVISDAQEVILRAYHPSGGEFESMANSIHWGQAKSRWLAVSIASLLFMALAAGWAYAQDTTAATPQEETAAAQQ